MAKNIGTEIAIIKNDIAYMKEKIDDLHEKVVGNGKTGLCDEMSQLKGGLTTVKIIYGALIALLGLVIALFH